MSYDWSSITSAAYMALLEQNAHEFPIPSDKIKCKGVKISSFQNYAKITGLSIEEIKLGNVLEDAFLLKLPKRIPLILFDADKSAARVKHSIWHEIGHVKLNHKKHGKDEEVEAHFFAAQANAPNILIKNISERGYTIDASFLKDCFGLSEESANKKKEYLSKYGFMHLNEYDDFILNMFSEYINAKYPLKTKHYYDEYFDEKEQERLNWH